VSQVSEAAGIPGVRVVVAGVDAPAPAEPRLIRFHDGLEVACQSRTEAEHIWEDIFDKKIYQRHGVTLPDNACVFDVGGNIGMFTLFVHLNCRAARTFTFEPAPPLFEILGHNTARHAPGAKLFNAGVSARRGTAELTFYPYSSGMSSFHADLDEEKAVLRSILEHHHEEGMSGVGRLLEVSDEFLDARFTSRTFECPLIPLSEVIAAERVEIIDLLKIDVQKAELEVLQGIEDRHWPKIRQIVMEVHDLDGRLGVVTEMLRGHGFDVLVEQDPLLTGSVLYNLFAIGRSAFGASGTTAAVPEGERPQSRASLQKAALQRQRARTPK
jgi:FkbM family methyltransferase